MSKWERMRIADITPNPDNPRVIKDDKFQKLTESIRTFPQMLELRPIVINADGVVLGGNMRLRACQAAGLKDVPVIRADTLTPEQQREFIIKDNVGFGEWDWDVLANAWDESKLIEWGLDIPSFDEPEKTTADDTENPYTAKIEAPIYRITGERPKLADVYDLTRYTKFVERIESSTLAAPEKMFLKMAATRHIVFDYSQIAELYAHANSEMQTLMEESALIIIDYQKAIELGYAKITDELMRHVRADGYVDDE